LKTQAEAKGDAEAHLKAGVLLPAAWRGLLTKSVKAGAVAAAWGSVKPLPCLLLPLCSLTVFRKTANDISYCFRQLRLLTELGKPPCSRASGNAADATM